MRARWTIVIDGERVDETGEVVGYQRITTVPGWSILVVNDAGKLRSPSLENVTIDVGDDTRARKEGTEAIEALDFLGRYLDGNYPDEDKSGTPVERTVRLLGELTTELLETGQDREQQASAASELSIECAELRKQVTELEQKLTNVKTTSGKAIAALEKDLSAARKKIKVKGPAGPGEDTKPETLGGDDPLASLLTRESNK